MSGVAERAATTRTKHIEVGDVRYAYRELGHNGPVDKLPSYSSINSKVHWTTGIHSSSMSWQKLATLSSSAIRKSVRRRETQQRAWTKRPGMLPLSLGL